MLQWIPVPATSGGWTIQSLLTEESIGYEGALKEGTYLIVGDSSVAKPFVFQTSALSLPQGIYRCDQLILSL
jgi:hypothetical protein